jgi:hypothetical protein
MAARCLCHCGSTLHKHNIKLVECLSIGSLQLNIHDYFARVSVSGEIPQFMEEICENFPSIFL